jgi:dye decolorizing peroxidase
VTEDPDPPPGPDPRPAPGSTAESESTLEPSGKPAFSRRDVLLGTGGILLAGAAGVIGFGLARDDHPDPAPGTPTTSTPTATTSPSSATTSAPTGFGSPSPTQSGLVPVTSTPAGTAPAVTSRATPAEPVPSSGVHQAGVALPAIPQSACLLVVADLDRTALRTSLAALGEAIARVTDPEAPPTAPTPDGPGDLTVTVGLGPDTLAASDHPELADLVTLPQFRGDAALPADHRGGDLLISVNASDPTILEPVLAHLTAQVAGLRERWSDFGYRGPADQGVSRNPFGYFDGIIVPRSADDLAADVWIAEGPLAGGTICVIRRFRLDTDGFRRLSATEQDRTVGRHRSDGSPLSGGDRFAEVDLSAKADNGDLVIPLHAHARGAHPSFTGSRLMLRRSYSYQHSATDHGHLFISHQNEVQAFAKTQLRLDEVDDLMHYATPTATAAFAILPGTLDAGGATRPLGGPLFR